MKNYEICIKRSQNLFSSNEPISCWASVNVAKKLLIINLKLNVKPEIKMILCVKNYEICKRFEELLSLNDLVSSTQRHF